MEFSEHQRLFLAAVCKHFHETGTWPTYGMIDKALRSHKDLDVEELGKELDRFMHDSIHAPLSGWDPDLKVTMNVSALRTCQVEGIFPALDDDLSAFMDVVLLCVERYETDKEEEQITTDDLYKRDPFAYADLTAKAFQLVLIESFYISCNYNQDQPAEWAIITPRSIRKYRTVKTLEDYLAVRSKLIDQQRPKLVYTGSSPKAQRSGWMPSLLSEYEVVEGNGADNASASSEIQRAIVGASTPAGVVHPDTTGNAVVPMELVEGTRPYIEKIAPQVNKTYTAECYDACAVMLRRLIETLIIEAFEAYNIANNIKVNGDFVQLGDLVDKTLAETSWNLGRTVKRELRQLKDVGNRSAHDKRYIATKSDIDKIASNVRGVVGELVALRP